jgi:uncharacterized membrane protein YfcA
MAGLGGGSFVVPFLDIIYGLAHEVSVATSSAMIVSTALSASFAYAKQRRIDYKIGITMMAGTIPSAFLSAQMLGFMKKILGENSSDLGKGLFGLFMMLVALRMIFISTRNTASESTRKWAWNRRIVDSQGNVFSYQADVFRGFPLTILAGFASGFFGVGGGAVAVPIMNVVMHVPMHIAVATSMFIMIFTSLSSTIAHLSLGNVIFLFAASLSIGIVVGTQLGAWLALRTKAKKLQRGFGLIAVVIGVLMIYSSLESLS